MKTADFDYNLPEELIAQTPIIERDTSKLLILDRNNGNICHKKFKDIVDYLNSDDVLVINNTKVIPARLIGVKEDTKATIELLLLKELSENVWECLAKPAKRLKVGTVIYFGGGVLKAEVMAKKAEGIVEIKLVYKGILYEILDMLGEMPLPPYIHEKLQEKDRYQTVYAKNIGSAAAPTAGLHFTPELLEKLKNKGIKIVEITLHVGLGTFRPVNVEDVTKHRMHSEYYEITKENANILEAARTNKQRIIAVGTTCVRTLEAVMQKQQKFIACSGNTDIFIYPGYEFKAVNGIITNFHLPKSTLLMLVSAFCSKEKIMQAYGEAIANNYRFFSFGDAMLII